MKKIFSLLATGALLLLGACEEHNVQAPEVKKTVNVKLTSEVPTVAYPGDELEFTFEMKYDGGLAAAYATADGKLVEGTETEYTDAPESATLSFKYVATDVYAGNSIDFAVVVNAVDGTVGHCDYPVFILASKPEVEFSYPADMPAEYMVDGNAVSFDIAVNSKNIDLKKVSVYKGEIPIEGLVFEMEAGARAFTVPFTYTPTLGDTGTPTSFTVEIMDVNGNLSTDTFAITFTKKESLELNEYSGITMGLNRCKDFGQFFDARKNIVYGPVGVNSRCEDIDISIFWSGNATTIGVAVAAPSTVNIASIYNAATIVTFHGATDADMPANWTTRNSTNFRLVDLDADGFAAISTIAEIETLFDNAEVPANDQVVFQNVAGRVIAFKSNRGADDSKIGILRITARNASNNTGSIVFDYKIAK